MTWLHRPCSCRMAIPVLGLLGTSRTAEACPRSTALQRISKHLRIGWRWLTGGWRLVMHNPWLLGGMGLTTAALTAVLALIPLLGGLLVALLAPVWLGRALLPLPG